MQAGDVAECVRARVECWSFDPGGGHLGRHVPRQARVASSPARRSGPRGPRKVKRPSPSPGTKAPKPGTPLLHLLGHFGAGLPSPSPAGGDPAAGAAIKPLLVSHS